METRFYPSPLKGELLNNVEATACIPQFITKSTQHQTTRNPQLITRNMSKEKRNYVLRPGRHQFLPGGHLFSQAATTDAELAWYLEQLPHIAPLFIKINGRRVNTTTR